MTAVRGRMAQTPSAAEAEASLPGWRIFVAMSLPLIPSPVHGVCIFSLALVPEPPVPGDQGPGLPVRAPLVDATEIIGPELPSCHVRTDGSSGLLTPLMIAIIGHRPLGASGARTRKAT